MLIDVAGPVFLTCALAAAICVQVGGWQIGAHDRRKLGWSVAVIGIALYIGGCAALLNSR